MKLIISVIILLLGFTFYSNFNYSTETATVNKLERVCSNQDDCRYLVFTDKGVFEDTDAWLHFKFNSSDLYGFIKVGQQYKFTLVGFRIPFLSMYKNILEAK